MLHGKAVRQKRGKRRENTGQSMIMTRAEIHAKYLSWGQLLTSGQEAAKGDYHNTMVNPKTATDESTPSYKFNEDRGKAHHSRV